MGQYYHSVNLETKEYVYSHTFGSGLKLMEHSWMLNPFVRYVENLIAEGGKWFGKPLVWAGDYAEPEIDENGEPIMVVDDDGQKYKCTLYFMCEVKIAPDNPKEYKGKHYRYVINETKKCFVDKNKIPKNNDGWRIHPLPLLTCEGNGKGGGDFFGDDMNNLVGSWSRDVITVSTKKPKGYSETIFDLIEN